MPRSRSKNMDESWYGLDAREPDDSCPHLNEAIQEIENARKIHEQLREWGNEWKDLAIEKAEQVEKLEKRISELEDELNDLHKELEAA